MFSPIRAALPTISEEQGVNGPDHKYRRKTLKDWEAELRTALTVAYKNFKLSRDEKKHYRAKIKSCINALNKAKYTWPSGKPHIPIAELALHTQPPNWRPRGKKKSDDEPEP